MKVKSSLRKKAWESSHRRGENLNFYPNEEVIRFLAEHVRKRVGLKKFRNIHRSRTRLRFLDLGCGTGRHVILSSDMGFDTHGIDLSKTAIHFARKWARSCGYYETAKQLLCGASQSLPWLDSFFNIVVSHAVLDSMTFADAQASIQEVRRVIASDGLFYCDFLSRRHDLPGFTERDTVIRSQFERGTVQSFYSISRVRKLVSPWFLIEKVVSVSRSGRSTFGKRIHVVLRPRPKATALI